MASYVFDPKKGRVRVFFRYGGKQFNKTLKAESDRAAGRICAVIEETIQDVVRGNLTMPPDADPVTFMISRGKRAGEPSHARPKTVTLGDLFDLYRADPPPHLEVSTRKMQEIHFRRLLEVFPACEVQKFDKGSAQTYIALRSKQEYRGRAIQRETIAKELKTFRQVWSWVVGRQPGIASPPVHYPGVELPQGAGEAAVHVMAGDRTCDRAGRAERNRDRRHVGLPLARPATGPGVPGQRPRDSVSPVHLPDVLRRCLHRGETIGVLPGPDQRLAV